MSDTPQERFNVTADDLRRYDWQAQITASKLPDCHDFCTQLIAAAKECQDGQDDLGYRVHSLLHVVASFYPNYDAKGNPYTSMWSGFDGKRSLNAEDLTDADLDALSGIVAEIKDPEYRARVADVIFERGLQAGFYGDWLVAMHLLIPQIEASIRYVLQHEGVVTSTLESDGTQKEWDLNILLWKPEVEQIFGADILFDLRGILTEKFGHNLRNDLAHGLLPEGGYYREACVYLWWLVLFLCYQGHVIAAKATEVEPTSKNPEQPPSADDDDSAIVVPLAE